MSLRILKDSQINPFVLKWRYSPLSYRVAVNLRQLEVFYAIMQTGTVSGAAKNLHVSQPNVTRVLAHTEQQLGFALFERVKGRLVPTPEAKTLLPEAEKIYQQLGQFRTLTTKVKNGQQHIRVGAPPVLATKLLPPIIARYYRQHTCSIELITGNQNELCDALLRNELDIAICFGDDAPAGVSHRLLTRQSMQILAPDDCYSRLQSNNSPIDDATLEQLMTDQLPVVGLDRRDPLGKKLTQAIECVIPDFVPSLSMRNYSSAAELAQLGIGIAIVDPWTARHYADGANLHQLNLFPTIDCSVSLLTSDEHALPMAAKQFVAELTASI